MNRICDTLNSLTGREIEQKRKGNRMRHQIFVISKNEV